MRLRARAELLDLRQGKRDIHADAQHVRYLVSCIVLSPIDEHTQVTVFIKRLTDGPVKNHLFRLELESLDQAISAAEQEDFSLQQAHVHSRILSSIETTGWRRSRTNGLLRCRELATSISRIQASTEVQSLSKYGSLRL